MINHQAKRNIECSVLYQTIHIKLNSLKKVISFLILILYSGISWSQSKLDTLFTSSEIIACRILEITDDIVKYNYPNENIPISIKKYSVKKIIFGSGRIQEFKGNTYLKKINSVNDYNSVYVCSTESELAGLHNLGIINATSTSQGVLGASLSDLTNYSSNKLKIMTYMSGGNCLYLKENYTNSTPMTNQTNLLSSTKVVSSTATAFTNELPNYEIFSEKHKNEYSYRIIKYYGVNNNNFDFFEKKFITEPIKLSISKNEAGEIIIKSTLAKIKDDTFKVIYFDDESITVMFKDNSVGAIYNIIFKKAL